MSARAMTKGDPQVKATNPYASLDYLRPLPVEGR